MGQESEGDGPARGPADERLASRRLGGYLGLGLQFAAAILLSVYLGQWLDRRFGTSWILLVCVAIGASAGFYSIYRKLMGDLRRDEERRTR